MDDMALITVTFTRDILCRLATVGKMANVGELMQVLIQKNFHTFW